MQAHTKAITQPTKVQPKNKFNIKIAKQLLFFLIKATIIGRK